MVLQAKSHLKDAQFDVNNTNHFHTRRMNNKPVEIGNYRIIGTLGSGQSGKVKLAVNKTTNDSYAIKIIKKSNLSDKPQLFKKLQQEIALMSLMDHPHILKLVEVFESPRHLHIVEEYAETGELFDLLVQESQLTEDHGMKLFRQMVYGIDYLHQLGICHRDLKPENILLDSTGNIKIADFGFARWMKSNIAETSCGSPHYAAPEIVKGIPYDGRTSDIWSLGIILFAMLAVCYLSPNYVFNWVISLQTNT